MPESKKSFGVKEREKLLEQSLHLLSKEENEQYGFILDKLERARTLREQSSKFFDGMTYIQDYITNENNRNTFLTPKRNDSEVRVNTGTSEKKLDAIKNELLTMEFKHSIEAYDEFDKLDADLGEDMTDIVSRTYLQERLPRRADSDSDATDELLSQRRAFRQEQMVTLSRRGKKAMRFAHNRTVSGLKVFPGETSMSPYYWNLQPYIVIYDRYNYTTAKALFSHYENFQHVSPNKKQREQYLGQHFEYRFGELEDGEVEVITYESVPTNEYQILVNGIPMLPSNAPLPWTYPGYSVQFFTNKAMSTEWLYGRPFTAMAKTMQALSNETIRLLIRKFQQALEPPLAVPSSGKVYARKMWDPGAITQGLSKDDFEQMTSHSGVTPGEFSMYNLIEQKTEEFIGTPNLAQGMTGSREMSATEVLTLTKQFVKQLGYTVLAHLRMSDILAEQRVHTILDNYLAPVGKKLSSATNTPIDLYRSFTLPETVLANNQIGKKTVYLVDQDLTQGELEEVLEYERAQEKAGNNVRFSFLNVNRLKQFSKYWFVTSSVQDREGTALDKVMFQDQFNQATAITEVTGQRVNPGVVIENFERKWKAKDWFQRSGPTQDQSEVAPEDMEALSQELEGLQAEGDNTGTLGAQTVEGLRGAAKSQANQVNQAAAVLA